MKIYLERSIFNRYLDVDPILHPATVQLFNEIKAGKFEAYTSIYVIDELKSAPDEKSKKMLNLIPEFNITVLPENFIVDNIADSYIEHNIIPLRYRIDAVHIAVATVYGLDKIISLNFQHIVREKTRTFSQYINTVYGYPSIDIKAPMDVIMEAIYND
jgi:predicted nucleic acid-binding protein